MKISKSKQELARIISENGGWRDGANFSAIEMHNGDVWFCKEKPKYIVGVGIFSFKDFSGIIEGKFAFPNWHQTILSSEEYFHLYPATDDKAEFCESVTRSIPEPESKPTIEQLAADYRNLLDFAQRKQQEADAAKADANAKLAELVAAGKALNLVISVGEKEQGLVITDWRDLQVGDIVWWSGDSRFSSGEYPVYDLEERDHNGPCGILLDVGSCKQWIDHEDEEWRFIRRP